MLGFAQVTLVGCTNDSIQSQIEDASVKLFPVIHFIRIHALRISFLYPSLDTPG
jgi:hypothetical protein